MKIVSCDCFEKEFENIKVSPTIRATDYDDLTGYEYDTGYDIETEDNVFINYKYCPYCGERIKVKA